MGEILAAGNVTGSPALASEVLLDAFEQVVVQWIAAIWGTPVAALLVDHRPPWPQSWGPSPHDQPWFTPLCAVVHIAWQAARWVGESRDVVALVRREFCCVCQ